MNPSLIWRHGWKVVKEKGALLFSATELGQQVIYPFYQIVHKPPHCGSLAMFDSRENAEKFICHSQHQIYPCLFVRSEESTLWRWQYSRLRILKSPDLPKGTVLADYVMLLKEEDLFMQSLRCQATG